MRDRNWHFVCARYLSRALAVVTLMTGAHAALGQPSIRHDEVRCIPRDEFTQFVAQILPPDQLRSVRLYFRSELFAEYYFVDMSESQARYSAVLPLPTDQTRRVVYYIEVVDQTFEISRSAEFVVGVQNDSCDPGPGALFVAGNPGIIIGAVSAGAPGIPAGFQATGIVGVVSAAGAGGAGGLGVGLAIGAAAGAAAGVGVLVASSDGGGAGTTTSTAPSSPTGPTGGPMPPGGATTSATTTTTTTTTTSSGPQGPDAPTTAPPTTTSEPPPPLSACFNWRADTGCIVSFESCSAPLELIVTHDWRMLGPPTPAPVPTPESNTRSFTYDFAGDPRCIGDVDFNRPVRLTVTDSFGRSAQVQQNISVQPASPLRSPTSSTAIVIRTSLAAQPPDGSVRGQILVDGVALPVMSNQGPLELRTRVTGEELLVEAVLQTRAAPGTLWEFDLSANRESSLDTVTPESGTAILIGNARIVFRLEGREGERLRFRAR